MSTSDVVIEGETVIEANTTTEPVDKSEPEEVKMLEIDNDGSWKSQKALLWQALPIALLLLISIVVQNILSILVFISLIITFDTVNDYVIKQSEQTRNISQKKTVLLTIYLVVCLCLIYPVISWHWLFSINNFWAWYSQETTFWKALFLVTVIDFLCKFITVLLKCFIMLISGRVLPVRIRGRAFMACEGFSQFFRCFVPIPEWSRYILANDVCYSRILCWLALILYIILKAIILKKKFSLVSFACKYKTATGAELQHADINDISALEEVKLCPICHEDYIQPVKLPCGHIYCQDCISVWFDREAHCPHCSSTAINSLILGFQSALPPLAQYTSSNCKWKTGATDYVIQFF